MYNRNVINREGGGILEKEIKSSKFNDIYEELADYLGSDIAIKIFQRYKGQQITFPVKLYAMQYIVEQIAQNKHGESVKEIARKYGYTEQWIRRMMKKRQTKESDII